MATTSRHNLNRIPDLVKHIRQSSTMHFSLSKETGLPRVSLRRIIDGLVCPDFESVARITAALEQRLGCCIDPRDIVAYKGEFLTSDLNDLLSAVQAEPHE